MPSFEELGVSPPLEEALAAEGEKKERRPQSRAKKRCQQSSLYTTKEADVH